LHRWLSCDTPTRLIVVKKYWYSAEWLTELRRSNSNDSGSHARGVGASQIATDALFLFAGYVFGLGCRRFDWKCSDLNLPSKRAAERFGFRDCFVSTG
jgi:hypothetical protein